MSKLIHIYTSEYDNRAHLQERRVGIERRQYLYSYYIPERRLNEDRRISSKECQLKKLSEELKWFEISDLDVKSG